MKPRIFADFLKKDAQGRLRLVSLGSLEDIQNNGLTIADRREVVFYCDDANASGQSDDLEANGVIEWDSEKGEWVGTFDSCSFNHRSTRVDKN